MRILVLFVILCTLLSVGSSGEEPDEASNYDVGIAAYKRGHYEVALYDFEKRADQGDPIAQFCLGYMYKHGKGVKANSQTALDWYKKAAKQNYAPALNDAAVMHVLLLEDIGHPFGKIAKNLPNFTETKESIVDFFQFGADMGDPIAQYNLGVLYSHGYEVPKDADMALKLFQKAAKQDYAPALVKFAMMRLLMGYEIKDQDPEKAREQVATSLKLSQKAAKKDYPPALFILALMYDEMFGVETDFEKSIKYHKRAAERGFAESQFFLGLRYADGFKVKQDLKEAIRWLTKAAAPNPKALNIDPGHAPAQLQLAIMYGQGKGVPQNYEKASRWLFAAAQQGLRDAQAYLGDAFKSWKGWQDNEEAYYWYSLALRDEGSLDVMFPTILQALSRLPLSRLSSAEVAASRELIGKKLSEEQRSKIHERIANWRPKFLVSSGTGFYINKKHILTNAHVVRDVYGYKYDEVRIAFPKKSGIAFHYVGEQRGAVDSKVDLALLVDERKHTDGVAIFRNYPVDFGDDVFLFGYPLTNVLSYRGNSTLGIVSGLLGTISDFDSDNLFQHTALQQPGNSGGPVFDHAGNVVGVSVSVLLTDIKMEGRPMPDRIQLIPRHANFAIKFEVIERFLRKNGITDFASTDLDIPIDQENIYENARKFTVPILCFKNKGKKPLPLEEIGIDGLKQ